MKIKQAFLIAALVVAPGIAAALGCSQERQAMSCAEGTVWDHDAQACVDRVSS